MHNIWITGTGNHITDQNDKDHFHEAISVFNEATNYLTSTTTDLLPGHVCSILLLQGTKFTPQHSIMRKMTHTYSILTICFCFKGFTEKLPSTCCKKGNIQ